jgi:outer membrane protein TolC
MKLILLNVVLFLIWITTLPLYAQQKLSLHDALVLAASSNPDLKSAELEVKKTSQQKVIARSLLLPSLSIGAQANHYFQVPAFFGFGNNTEGGKIPYGRFGGEDQLNAAVSAVQPIYNPLAFPSIQRSRIQEEQSSVASRAKQIAVLSEVKETYLQVLVLNERIRLKQESINRNKRVLQDSRSLFLQGKGLRVDTLRAYTLMKNLEPDLVKLQFEAETGKLKLKTLIGLDSVTDFALVDSLTIPVPEAIPAEEEVYEAVKNNNPEFQLLKIQSQIEKQQQRVASAYRKPSLSLVGLYQVQSQTNHLEYNNAHYPTSSYVGLQLSMPLFTGFSNHARVKQANLSKDQADLNVRYTQEKLRTSVHQAIANQKETLLRLENTSIVQETAQLSYNIIQYRYKNGISSRLELTDAELALSTAQSNYLEAVYDYLTARIALRKLMGIAEAE